MVLSAWITTVVAAWVHSMENARHADAPVRAIAWRTAHPCHTRTGSVFMDAHPFKA
jgi:hypothetical protein